MRRPENSLGDLIRAFDVLQPADRQTERAIAELLGIGPADANIVELKPEPEPDPDDVKPLPQTAPRPSTAEKPGERKPPSRPFREHHEFQQQSRRSTVLEQLSPDEPVRQLPRRPPRPLEDLLAIDGRWNAGPPVESSLFVSRWQRALLSTALSTTAWDGPLDVDAIVQRLARGETVAHLPRLAVPTLRRGLQLLLDFGEGLRPFSRDRQQIEAVIRHTFGADNVDVLRFAGCPTRAEGAGPGSMRTWRAYEPPTPGTPVLVVSDLGISRSRAAGGASPEEWLAFADLVAATGRRCVALVPFPPHRWPAALERAMHIVHWDRTTSVHTVQRALRGAAPEASEFSPRL